MHRKWLPLNALRAFEAAGQHLSFTAAANSLTVAQSAVSRHVIVLEKFLGVTLFERRPQQLVLTEAGRHLLPVVTKSFDRIDTALSEIIKERGQPKSVLKVHLSPTFAHQLAIPILKDFRAEHPEIDLEIGSKPSGANTDNEWDIGIIYSEPSVSDSIHDLLWMVRLTILCSPKMLEGADLSDIGAFVAKHDLLHVMLENRPRHYLWEIFMRTIGRTDLAADRGVVFDTARLAVQYALSGEGICLVDPMLFADEIASGKLVRPFDVSVPDGYGYYLTVHPELLNNEAVTFFRSWLIKRFAEMSGGETISADV